MLIYFIPTDQTTNCSPELLAEHKLDRVIDNAVICPARSGPNGKPGLIVVEREIHSKPVPYHAAGQTWVQSLDSESWVGYIGKQPPRVHTLARRDQLPGKYVRLNSGESIVIPIARRFIESGDGLFFATALPQAMGRDRDTGQWVPKQIVAKYVALWNYVQGYLDAQEAAIRASDVDDGESVWFSYDQMPELIIAAIAANYRIGADEVELLGIYDQSLHSTVVNVLTDNDTRDAWVKKKLRDLTSPGSISADGPTPSTTDKQANTPRA